MPIHCSLEQVYVELAVNLSGLKVLNVGFLIVERTESNP